MGQNNEWTGVVVRVWIGRCEGRVGHGLSVQQAFRRETRDWTDLGLAPITTDGGPKTVNRPPY